MTKMPRPTRAGELRGSIQKVNQERLMRIRDMGGGSSSRPYQRQLSSSRKYLSIFSHH